MPPVRRVPADASGCHHPSAVKLPGRSEAARLPPATARRTQSGISPPAKPPNQFWIPARCRDISTALGREYGPGLPFGTNGAKL